MEGDVALTAMLLLHGLAMNGGLLDAVAGMPEDEVVRAVAGYRYFGLNDAAAVVEWVAQEVRHLDPQDSNGEDELERQADHRYGAVVPNDSVLDQRFVHKYQEQPAAFAPVG